MATFDRLDRLIQSDQFSRMTENAPTDERDEDPSDNETPCTLDPIDHQRGGTLVAISG